MGKDQDHSEKTGAPKPKYWRGIGELENSEEHQLWVEDEFPYRSSLKSLDRRSFLKVAGASALLTSLAGCRGLFLPQEKLIPYVKAPEDRIPGELIYYATTVPFQGYGFGVLARSYEGRPLKLEGNPSHPDSLGMTDAFTQAQVLDFYDPDRLQAIQHEGLISTWDEFLAASRAALDAQKADQGAKVRILTEGTTSPTLTALITSFLQRFPAAKWCQFETAVPDNAFEGSRLAFGELAEPIYNLANADVILSLDGDFLGSSPRWVRNTHEYSSRRKISGANANLNRLYAVESAPTLTGSLSDHRLPVKPSQVETVARAIASALGLGVSGNSLPSAASKWVEAVGRDLMAHRGRAVVIPGEHQSAAVHALAHAMNDVLGASGSTVTYIEPVRSQWTNQVESLKELTQDMHSKKVEMLLILGGNPVYGAPADIPFADALPSVKHTIKLGLFEDETSKLCKWVVPESHFLEAWGDLRSGDGTASIIQPLMSPLYSASKSSIEMLAALMRLDKQPLAIVQDTWRGHLGTNFDKKWRQALHNGVVPGTRRAPKPVTVNLTLGAESSPSNGLEAVFVPDPTIFDGRFVNNGWLQELPKPLTKLTWDNAVHLSPKTAMDLGVKDQDLVQVQGAGKSVEAAVFVMPGHPDGAATLHLGYGHSVSGKVGIGTGFNFAMLRSSATMGFGPIQVAKGSGTYPLATAQYHHSMEGRDIIRDGSLEDFKKDPALKPEGFEGVFEHTLYNETEEWAKQGLPQWGMTIDLDKCVGCNACVVACQSENNIPTVGKIEVQRGREMHWIRIDRYYRVHDGAESKDVGSSISNPDDVDAGKRDPDILDPMKLTTHFQPVACMHCEIAPCEPVCPVAATVHSHEGLNQMVYNRCVGTRYCSNNCPYKVRRFNFFNYQHGGKNLDKPYGNANFVGEADVPLLSLLSNPDVTVRSRGVMEKCTYCVQRINTARIQSKKERRDLRDGEIVTACQQACPAQAIVFGNIADKQSAVSKLKAEPRNYGLLSEVNTHPRTSYLAKVRNLNPEMVEA